MAAIPGHLLLAQDQVRIIDHGPAGDEAYDPPRLLMMHASDASAALDASPEQYELHDPHDGPVAVGPNTIVSFLASMFPTQWATHLRSRPWSGLPDEEVDAQKKAYRETADKARSDRIAAAKQTVDVPPLLSEDDRRSNEEDEHAAFRAAATENAPAAYRPPVGPSNDESGEP